MEIFIGENSSKLRLLPFVPRPAFEPLTARSRYEFNDYLSQVELKLIIFKESYLSITC